MNVKLAKLIVEKGYLSLDNLKTAVEEQKNTDKSLGIILIEHGFITEQQLLEITNQENEFESVDLNTMDIPEMVIKLIPGDNAKAHNLIPFELNGSFLSVAMLDPTNIVLIDELRFLTGYNIKPFITLYSCIRNALNRYYSLEPEKETKLESVDINSGYESKGQDLSVNDEGYKEVRPDINQELSVSQGSNSEQAFIEASQDIIDHQNTASEVIKTPNEVQAAQQKSEDHKTADPEPADEDKKVLDKIDIFNLSPDELEESRNYISKSSKENEFSSPKDLELNGFQTPEEVKADTSPNLPGDTSVSEINIDNQFQAPTKPIKQDSVASDNLFKTPSVKDPEQSDESQNLFTAPDKTQESKTEKEFGIPFTFKPDDEPAKLELEAESVEVTNQEAPQGSQADPFRAFSGNNQGMSDNFSTETTSPASIDHKADIIKSVDVDTESVEKAEHVELQDVVEPPAEGIDNQDVFQSGVSSQSDKIYEKITVTQDEEEVQQTGNDETGSPSIVLELEAINVDTSYDNIESLNKDIQKQESTPTPAGTKPESHETQTVQEQEVNVATSQNNGSSADVNAVNEKILQLEDDSLEQDDDIVRPTVLVVDDSPTIQKIISVTLNRRGYNVEVSSNAMQALAKLNDCIPDIIFLDINLPHMDGYQLCKVIKSNELTKTIPVVMLSGKDGFFDKMRGKMVGATDYITKPFEPNTLVNAIEKQGITIARTN